MSHFGAKLEELLEKNQLSAADLCRATKISDALISKYINGLQTFVSADNMEAITGAISTNPVEQAELIRAHLYDECVGQGHKLIDISIRGHEHELDEATTPYRVIPPQLKIQRALEILGRASITDADVRNILLSLANLFEKETDTTEKRRPTASETQDIGDRASAALIKDLKKADEP